MSAFLTRTKRLEKEGASVAASVGVAGRASSLLEPCNESLDGEGLGELSAGGRSRGRAGSRCGHLLDGQPPVRDTGDTATPTRGSAVPTTRPNRPRENDGGMEPQPQA